MPSLKQKVLWWNLEDLVLLNFFLYAAHISVPGSLWAFSQIQQLHRIVRMFAAPGKCCVLNSLSIYVDHFFFLD